MTRQIFVNFPVKDLTKSVEFFTKLDFTFNPQFTNEDATCMIVDQNIFVMLLVEKFFQTFTPKEICDTSKNTEVLVSLACESRAEVDAMIAKAISAGGTTYKEPNDMGFMYQHGFQDLDGHLWEIFFMDESAMAQAT